MEATYCNFENPSVVANNILPFKVKFHIFHRFNVFFISSNLEERFSLCSIASLYDNTIPNSFICFEQFKPQGFFLLCLSDPNQIISVLSMLICNPDIFLNMFNLLRKFFTDASSANIPVNLILYMGDMGQVVHNYKRV